MSSPFFVFFLYTFRRAASERPHQAPNRQPHPPLFLKLFGALFAQVPTADPVKAVSQRQRRLDRGQTAALNLRAPEK